jgi:uncharacterized protein YlxW (UPF0749 family)
MISFTFITIIVGFMLAIQFQSVQQPNVRDTRDTWQLREDLQKEKELQSKLIQEIRSNEEKLAEYTTERKNSKEQTLRNTLNELKVEAGLTEVTGPGLNLYIDKLNDELFVEPVAATLSPDLLRRLLNEINRYGGMHVSIGGQRVINTTVIREIANETKINGRSLNQFPIEIKVVTEDFETAEKLYNRMEISPAAEEFFVDNLTVSVTKPELEVTVPAYEDTIRVRNIEPATQNKGGSK